MQRKTQLPLKRGKSEISESHPYPSLCTDTLGKSVGLSEPFVSLGGVMSNRRRMPFTWQNYVRIPFNRHTFRNYRKA